MDTGGTFTDLVLIHGEEVRAEKLPSTPDDPSRAVLEGIELLGGTQSRDEVVHGTTVALNALLTRRFAPAAMVVNEGFLDLIEIGRQARPELYALHPQKIPALIPRELRFEVGQRSWPAEGGDLETVHQPTNQELTELGEHIRQSKAMRH